MTRAQAAKLLDARFSGGGKFGGKKNGKTVVLMVDELDHLVTRKQTVLYAFAPRTLSSI